ncbi:MAG TPA: polysaccharide lyase family 8 super-sandwich domain-containing protein [Candidatus Hydrogenedentes bacterium]|nr:polysaccharide lyase family 8 super-sandwich domain-containing protein [Candidatus Hydrogenedentota bacterium]HPG69160.1 polysaccharide lyase family 8 super-sandwich domain-containing protein [Candidatus Hydrogenedentota bacterium]
MNSVVLPLCLFGVAAIAADAAALEDIEVIRDRIIARYLPAPGAPLERVAAAATGCAQQLAEDGSWPDVDYASDSRSRWATANHLARLRDMTVAYCAPGSPAKGETALVEAICRSLDFWMAEDFRNPNWWWNEIGVQLSLGPTLLLLDGAATPEQQARSIEIMKRSRWATWTGQNLVWGATIQIMRGCIENSPDVIREAYDRMYEEIRIAQPGEEGVQVDFSFHQHGAQLYSGGYGLGFATNGAEFIHHARGTQFAAPDSVVDVMKGYVLDGQQWMMRALTFDYSAVGREITRPGKSGSVMLIAASNLAELGGDRVPELEAFITRMKTAGAECPLRGNRHFWRSDYTAHHRPGYFASVRMASTRNRRSEVCNSEGRKSHHLADGVMYVYVDGQEHADIFPVWDWQRIPGTTCEQMDWAAKGGVGGTGETDFVGGVSDGEYGLAAMGFERGALKARKAWFCFDEAIVCLGAAIACDGANAVLTTVNQCHLRGNVLVSSAAQPLESGTHELPGPAWVHHNKVGYVFPNEGVVRVANQAQTGAWADIGTGSDKQIDLDVFSLWLDHGDRVSNADYAYVVYPKVSVEELEGRVAASDFEVLANTGQVQAVRDKASGMIQAAFYEAGALGDGEGRFLRVDQPCLIMLRDTDESACIAISNPLNQPLTVNADIALALEGEGCTPLPDGGTRVTLVLPDGAMAGSSLVRVFAG